jgi:membrane associated rhomboid family serine protease
MVRITETVKILLGINILMFVVTLMMGDMAYHWFAMHFPYNERFQFWQIITHMFMHGDEMHLLLNMFMLYMFGSVMEETLGRSKFLFLYFSAGLGALGLHVLFLYIGYQTSYQAFIDAGITPEMIHELLDRITRTGQFQYFTNMPMEVSSSLYSSYFSSMVGASGAVFGLLAAFAVMYPNMPLYLFFIPVPIKAKYLIGAYFVYSLYAAISGNQLAGPANIAHWAHIGGAIFGFIMMWYWKKNSFNDRRWY